MEKVARVDAFRAVKEAMACNDIKTANAIFAIVSQAIEKDKKITSFLNILN